MCDHDLPRYDFFDIKTPVSLPESMGRCEHVEADISLAVTKVMRTDACTTEVHALCSPCLGELLRKLDKEEEEEEKGFTVCFDCKESVSNKEIWGWRWYDFYSPQGDEPLMICKDCRKKHKHINRVRKDQEDYEEEMRRYD